MDLGKGTKYDRLFDVLDEEKKRIADAANAFPASAEEYQELSLEERMEVAKRVLSKYAKYSEYLGYTKYVIIPMNERPGMNLVARVRLVPDFINKKLGDPKVETIDVDVYASDPETKMNGEYMPIGSLVNGMHSNTEGESQDGWHIVTDTRGSTATLDSSRGKDAIEFVDLMVASVINGDIARHRSLIGATALAEATENQPESPPTPTQLNRLTDYRL